MKNAIIAIILIILIAGCAQQSKLNGITEPENVYKRDVALMAINIDIASKLGLPVVVPYLGDMDEDKESMGKRVLQEGMKSEMIYWGIRVFMKEVEEEPSWKDAYTQSSEMAMVQILKEKNATKIARDAKDRYFPDYTAALPLFNNFLERYEESAAEKD